MRSGGTTRLRQRCRGATLGRVKKLVASIAGAFVLLFGLLSGRLVRRYRVECRSMLRAYAPGDRLIVERVRYRLQPPSVGDAVVVRRPGAQGRLDLKRIAAGPGGHVTIEGEERVLGEDEWYVLGDNLGESTDSRQLGPVKTHDIIGRVWFKY
jgi:signal peptidase I